MKKIVIFASGQGSNAANIIHYFKENQKAEVSLVVCNKAGAGVVAIAQQHNIPVLITSKNEMNESGFAQQIVQYGVDIIVLAGFLLKIPETLVQIFPNKIINIHPALLPKYGGKGMYGAYVHEAVCKAGEKESGITIHYVNENYDEGGHILQAHCRLHAQETPESLASKISQLEQRFFPVTIDYLLHLQ